MRIQIQFDDRLSYWLKKVHLPSVEFLYVIGLLDYYLTSNSDLYYGCTTCTILKGIGNSHCILLDNIIVGFHRKCTNMFTTFA